VGRIDAEDDQGWNRAGSEIGPGKSSGLMKRIDSSVGTGNVEDIQSLKRISS
jgi:hypothetical protein